MKKSFYFILILLINVMCLKFVNGYKCKFKNNHSYECVVQPDETVRSERHLSRKNDNSVKTVNFNGNTNEIWDLNHSNFRFCRRFTNLENYLISDIESIDDEFFHKCKNLDTIWIQNTNIAEISENLFSYNSKLIELKLEDNEFTTLPENVFAELHDLKILSLYSNKINSLPPKIFQPLVNLEELFISRNDLEYLDVNWFKNLENLKILDLCQNNLTNLPKNVFVNLINLEQLQLYENKLTIIDADSFGMHQNLKIFRLTNNSINAIDPKITEKMINANIFMEGNECSQELISLSNQNENVNRKLKICFKNYQTGKQIHCGKGVQSHIVKGDETFPGEYPWNVALVHNSMLGFFCGGTLVSRKFVLTAAHCMKNKFHGHEFTHRDFTVLIGVHNISAYNAGLVTGKAVKAIKIHPDWNINVMNYDADIALLELEKEVFDILPICLADEISAINKATKGTAVGFGITETGNTANVAQKLDIPIYDFHNCTQFEDELRIITSARTFCGGPSDGRGVCDGDSGSGVYVIHNKRFYLKGIVSASLLEGGVNVCNVHKQAVFTDVTRFYGWIKENHETAGISFKSELAGLHFGGPATVVRTPLEPPPKKEVGYIRRVVYEP